MFWLAGLMLAQDMPSDMAKRGRIFAEALLTTPEARALPFAVPDLVYNAWKAPGAPHPLPSVPNTRSGFRNILRDCTVVDTRLYDPKARRPGDYPVIHVELKCPRDAAHAGGVLYLSLRFAGDRFTQADLQIGIGPPPAPPLSAR